MAEAFNPYREWLGVDAAGLPSHYQLLSLPLYEEDQAKIAAAADRAMARVRGFRPGTNAAEWSRLLDEVHTARECLLGAAAKSEYDAKLRSGAATSSAPAAAAPASREPSSTTSHADFYPPGMGPGGKRAKDEPAPKRPEAIEPKQPAAASQPGRSQSSPAMPTAAPPSAFAPPVEAAPSPAEVAAMMPPGAAAPGAGAATAAPAPAPLAGSPAPSTASAAWPAAAPAAPLAGMPYAQQPLAGTTGAYPYALPMAGAPMAGAMGQMPMAWPMGHPAAPLAAPYAHPMNPYGGAPGLGYPTAMPAGYPSALPPAGPPPAPPPTYAGDPAAYGMPATFSGNAAFGGNATFGGHAAFGGSVAAPSLDPMAPLTMPGVAGPMGSAPAAVPMSGQSLTGHLPMGSAVPVGSPMPGNAVPAGGANGASHDQSINLPKRSSASAAALASKRERKAQQTLILAASGGLLMLLVAGGIYVAMTNSDSPEVAQSQSSGHDNPTGERAQPIERSVESALPVRGKSAGPPANSDTRSTTPPAPAPGPLQPEQPAPMSTSETPAATPAPPATPDPAPMPEPAPPAPAPAPTPAPATPTPTPPPAPTPEPTPPTPTATPTPESAPLVKRADAIKLGKALTAAKAALAEHNFDEADKQIAAAEPLAQLPEHKAKLTRLKEIAGYVKQFREAIAAAVAEMDAGSTFKVGTSTQVAVVETFPDKIIVRTAGQNRAYPFQDLPPGLAVAIADFKFDAADPVTRVVKAAYLAVMKPDDEDVLSKAKALLEEAQLGGADTESIQTFLTDKYDDLAKDIPVDGEKQPENAPQPNAADSDSP